MTKALERALLKRDFGSFADWAWTLVTGSPLVRNGATDALVQALQDVADGKVTRLLVAMPPGVGKSTVLACYAAWRLARDPSHRSIHAAHAFELAATESRRVRRLVEGDEYRAMFPAVALREDESTVAHWATTSDGRYIAVGSDGALTGRRAHEAVLDDPLNAIDRFSKSARDTLWAWFCESLSTRLDGDRAPIIVVQQRLDRDDLIGRLLEQPGWTLVELPAEREDGTLLAPTILSRDKLDALRAQIGAAAYACQYLQRPASDDDAIVKRGWWRFHYAKPTPASAPRPAGCDSGSHAVETPIKYDQLVIACDLTFGSLRGDYAVAQVWGAVGGARYLLEQWRKKSSQLEQQAAIKALAQKYPRAKVLVEKAAGGAGAIEQLTAAGVPNIVAVSPGGKGKAERLGLVSPAIEGGHVYLPLGAPWLADYVEELSGNSKHDDSADATAYALAGLSTMRSRPAWVDLFSDAPPTGTVRDPATKRLITGPCARGHTWVGGADGRTRCTRCKVTPRDAEP
jgi:predicted phage terminase large subunit-like protein